MSMLKEIIEIKKPVSEVWRYLNLSRWPEVSSIFQNVEPQDESMQVGSRYVVTAGPGETQVKYNVEIVTCEEKSGKLTYERTGGPLPGTSEWSLTPTATGTKVEYTNYYQHDLTSTVLSSITRAMERFLEDLRTAVESSGHQ